MGTEVKVSSRNEALEMQTFLFAQGMAVSVRRLGPKSYAWDADVQPVGYAVAFREVQS